MTKRELIEALKELQQGEDKEGNHNKADRLLLMFINDDIVTEEFDKIEKWYSK